MKRVIKAGESHNKRRRMERLVRYLASEGVAEHTMLFKFLDDLDPEVTTQLLEELADECSIDMSYFEEY